MGSVSANTLRSIDTTVDIDENGNGHVTEIWKLDANEGTESYHSFGQMDDRSITNFSVSMDGKSYSALSSWNVNASKSSKAYKNGINYTDDGLELCWGIEYGFHTYIVKYTVENLVWQYDDNQILYFAFLPVDMNPAPDSFNLVITTGKPLTNIKYSSYGFDSDNKIVSDKIYFTSKGSMDSSEYVVALVGFPNGTFSSLLTKNGTFDDVADKALEGASLNEESDTLLTILFILFFGIVFVVIIVVIIFENRKKPRYDETEFIIPKEINNFRDIPFNKSVFEAYFIGERKGIIKSENLMGSILLKWIKEKQIVMVPTEGGILDFNKNDNYYIDLSSLTSFSNKSEEVLCSFLIQASDDNKYLTPKQFKKWSSNNYTKIESWLNDSKDWSRDLLINLGYIEQGEENYTKNKTRIVYKFTNRLAEEFIKLKGLKRFLKDMTLIDEKKAIEVHIWDEYLIFAEAFGMAEEVAKQFKELHPVSYNDNINYYNNYMMIHYFSMTSMNAVSAARSAASSGGSFSGGGMSSGGFSSGGGVR